MKRTRLSRSFSRRPPSGLLNPDRTRILLALPCPCSQLAAGRRGSARRTGSPAHDPARGLSALNHHCRPRLSAWDTCDSWPDGQMVSKGLDRPCRRDASLVELWLAVGISPIPARLLFSSSQTWASCFFSPANIHTGMEKITRKCLTYSHVHASHLRGPHSGGP